MNTTTAETLATRYHPRVTADFPVKLKAGARTILAQARDLSMEGLSVVGQLVGIESRVTISFELPNVGLVTTLARVKRVSAHETALELDQLDWDDMMTLARFLHPRLP